MIYPSALPYRTNVHKSPGVRTVTCLAEGTRATTEPAWEGVRRMLTYPPDVSAVLLYGMEGRAVKFQISGLQVRSDWQRSLYTIGCPASGWQFLFRYCTVRVFLSLYPAARAG